MTVRVQMVKPDKSDDVFINFLASAIGLFLRPAVVMLGLDSARDVFPGIPAVGYWQLFWIVMAFVWVAASFRDHRTNWFSS
jgi:Ca2+/H+ antiporter